MSNHQEERGTYIIPAKELPGLHKVLRNYANDFHAKVRAEVERLHQLAGGTRSVKKYAGAMRGHSIFDSWYRAGGLFGIPRGADPVDTAAAEIIDQMLTDAHRGVRGIHKPTLTEIQRHAPKVTNRTDTFHPDHETTIAFKGRTVTWGVMENNRSVDHAHQSPMAEVFWGRMNRIHWTRNSGGCSLYADEYSRELGGGGDSETNAYGPLGGQPTGARPAPKPSFYPAPRFY